MEATHAEHGQNDTWKLFAGVIPCPSALEADPSSCEIPVFHVTEALKSLWPAPGQASFQAVIPAPAFCLTGLRQHKPLPN